MARSEARLQFSIWREGLDGLTPHARLMYVVLLTEPTVNHAGIGAVRSSRWARNSGLTLEEAEKALRELTDGQYLLIDEDTEEVFVRTLIRNDGVADQPNVLKGALREALHTASPALRKAIAAELRKLPPKQPDGVSKAGRPVVYPDPHATAELLDPQNPSPSPKKASRNPSGTLPEEIQAVPETPGGGGGGGGDVSSSGGTPVGRSAQKRATRIPEDFEVTASMVEWARREVPHVDGRRETQKFIDHFRAASGATARKQDWVSAWRNWMRKADEYAAPRGRQLKVVGGHHADPANGVFWEQ